MKTYNPFRGWFPFLSALGALVCLPGALLPVAATDSKATGYDLEIVEGQLIRAGHKVDATLPNVVDALRDQYTEANIILAPGLTKLKVGDLKLRAGRLAEELEAVRVASGDKFEVLGPGGPNPPQMNVMIDPKTGLPLSGTQQPDAGLFVLREARPTQQTERVVAALNIGPYLEWLRAQPHEGGQTADDEGKALEEISRILHDTIAALKGESNAADQPTWQYHRGATLVVVIGTIESVEIARKIINALPGMASVGDASRAAYGLEPPRIPAASDHAARDAATQDAFRARYGFPRLPVRLPQSGAAAPEPGPPK